MTRYEAGMRDHIFLSYSTQDKARVRSVLDHLKNTDLPGMRADLKIYDPSEGVPPAADVRESILEGIRNAAGVIGIWSSSASTSPRVHYELGLAAALNIPVTIVVVEEGAPRLPSDIANLNVVRLSEGEPA